jgi:hypothetical protein
MALIGCLNHWAKEAAFLLGLHTHTKCLIRIWIDPNQTEFTAYIKTMKVLISVKTFHKTIVWKILEDNRSENTVDLDFIDAPGKSVFGRIKCETNDSKLAVV